MSYFPTMEQVEEATAVQLVGWLRYLPSPTDEQRHIMERMIERRDELSDDARIAASKAVGWG